MATNGRPFQNYARLGKSNILTIKRKKAKELKLKNQPFSIEKTDTELIFKKLKKRTEKYKILTKTEKYSQFRCSKFFEKLAIENNRAYEIQNIRNGFKLKLDNFITSK